MLSRYLGAAALALQCASAFRDASPFFMFSSSNLDSQQLHDAQVASSSTIESNVAALMTDCSSHAYVFVTQPGVSSADFTTQQPHLVRRLNGDDKQIKSAVKISNVAGEVRVGRLNAAVNNHCRSTTGTLKHTNVFGSDGKVPHIKQEAQSINVVFSAPPTEKDERAYALAQADSILNNILTQLDAYTVIYTTTPISAEHYQDIQHPDQVYEMDSPFPSGMHGDLKRDLRADRSNSTDNTGNLYYDVPLFEKYQFVNQGIFIGGAVTLLLLFILSIGIRAISGLEVSYMAFSKEMGPAAQKKQQ